MPSAARIPLEPIAAAPPPAKAGDADLGDLRFMQLLAAEDWARLPAPVRRRFCKRLAGGVSVTYVGEVAEIWASLAGRLISEAARLIGAPLPLVRDAGVSVVTVTEDGATGGQVWSRLYARRRGFPQVIHSAKRFSGPTGLEEYVGCGVGMALDVAVEGEVLVFRSNHYFLSLPGGPRLRLPGWAAPGRLTVTHAELGQGRFAFTLDLTHRWLGPLLRQRAVFREDAR